MPIMGKLGSHGWNWLKICPHDHKKNEKNRQAYPLILGAPGAP